MKINSTKHQFIVTSRTLSKIRNKDSCRVCNKPFMVGDEVFTKRSGRHCTRTYHVACANSKGFDLTPIGKEVASSQ